MGLIFRNWSRQGRRRHPRSGQRARTRDAVGTGRMAAPSLAMRWALRSPHF